jgi:hypothetical protein
MVSTIQPANFGQTFSRASVVPLFLFLLVAAYLVPTQLFAHPSPSSPTPDHSSVVWKASYSERYPGCVATVLWPATETPVALVIVAPDGSTARLTNEEARQRAAQGQVVRTIGACRIPE